MSTSSIGLNMSTLRYALPILSGALWTLAVVPASYDFINPREGAKLFGLIIPASPNSTKASTSDRDSDGVTPTEKALIRIHGIRNFASGAGGMGLLALLYFSPLCKDSPAAAEAVRKSIGVLLVVGSTVGFTDGWILKQFEQERGISAEAKELAGKQAQGHTFTAMMIFGLGAAWLYA